MLTIRMNAADKGIQTGDPMDEAMCNQEFERAVYGRRRHPAALTAQSIKQRIGADWLVAAPNQFQHTAAQFRQPRSAARAKSFSRAKRGRYAIGMIVVLRLKRRRSAAFAR